MAQTIRFRGTRLKAVPIWKTFMAWAKRMQMEGVRDARTQDALDYLIKREQGLRRYCEDGRLPISNIQSEHVAMTVALSRKNFMFADTPSGAAASAMSYSVLKVRRRTGIPTCWPT